MSRRIRLCSCPQLAGISTEERPSAEPYLYLGHFNFVLKQLHLQLIYPLSCEEAAGTEEGSSKETRLHKLDAKLDQLMGVVRLRYLLQRQGGWDSVAEWGDVLSLGES